MSIQRSRTLFGRQKYRFGQAEAQDQVGQVTGLAWTEVGGELLTIEAMGSRKRESNHHRKTR